jgi:hypothetical protein
MSRGFIFGAAPLKLTTPVITPVVVASMETVPALAPDDAEEDGSPAGCDLPQPASIPSEISTTLSKILVSPG